MPHVMLYDGVCGLCNRGVRFVLARDRRDLFRFASLESAFARGRLRAAGRDPGTRDTFYAITEDGRLLERSRATIFVIGTFGGPWRFVASILSFVPRRVLDAAYDAVARGRYRTFGRYDACPVPRPEDRQKFLEA